MQRYDTVVVGSGFGGAVMAARLAEAGDRVLVLERGPWWGGTGSRDEAAMDVERSPFPRGARIGRFVRNVRLRRGRRSRELMFTRRGLFEFHGFSGLWTIGASGVGGGSLVYANGQGVPAADYWDAFPPELTARDMAPFFDRAGAMLAPARLPDWEDRRAALDAALQAVGAGRTGSVEVAVSFGDDPAAPVRFDNPVGVEQQTCRMCGDCLVGCDHRSKNTLDLNYIPLAARCGAVIRPMCEVGHIRAIDGGYEVGWTDHRDGSAGTTTARRLVLAAGTLNTLQLLFSARRERGLGPLPDALGRRFSPNGDYASLLWRVPSGPAARGVVFNAIRHDDATGSGGGDGLFIGEASMPIDSLPIPGWLRHRLDASRFLFVLGRDNGQATAWFDGRSVRADASRVTDPAYFERVDEMSRELAASYSPARTITNIPFGGGSSTIATTHTLGGVGMARSRADAVVDHTGQVLGHPGLYVVDGSILAAPPGVPPSRTIAAMAERIASIAVDEAGR